MYLDTAYVAGIVDADGYIPVFRGLSGGARSPSTAIMVNITNTYLPLLEEIQLEWGGSIFIRPAKGGGLPTGKLNITGDNAVTLLEAILPHLRVKACEAWLALEFRANCRKHDRGEPIAEEEDALREGYYLASKYARHNRMSLRR